MPVLSFPCVVTHHDGATETHRRRTWIKGHDLYALALAATEQLAARVEECAYKLFIPEVPHPTGVLLEVVHAGHSALVGPMAGPIPPPTMDQSSGYALPQLLAQVGLGPDATAQWMYPVIVTYSGIFRDEACPPTRKPIESDRQYRERCAAAESIRLERAAHEGVHVVRYEFDPAAWTAIDLERLLGLTYHLLPTREPQWRESGAILQELFGSHDGSRTPTMQYCLHVARGDSAAYVRLPIFPVRALVDWLGTRPCQILLDHPIAKLEARRPNEGAQVFGGGR